MFDEHSILGCFYFKNSKPSFFRVYIIPDEPSVVFLTSDPLYVLFFFFLATSKIVPFISGFHLLILGPGALSCLFCLVLWMLSITPFLLQ